MTILGQNIRYLRIKAGMTQQQLGAKCYLTKDGISRLETDKHSRQTIRHELLAQYLGYSIEYLTTTIIEPPQNKYSYVQNATCEAIESELILRGFCIKTTNKFEL